MMKGRIPGLGVQVYYFSPFSFSVELLVVLLPSGLWLASKYCTTLFTYHKIKIHVFTNLPQGTTLAYIFSCTQLALRVRAGVAIVTPKKKKLS